MVRPESGRQAARRRRVRHLMRVVMAPLGLPHCLWGRRRAWWRQGRPWKCGRMSEGGGGLRAAASKLGWWQAAGRGRRIGRAAGRCKRSLVAGHGGACEPRPLPGAPARRILLHSTPLDFCAPQRDSRQCAATLAGGLRLLTAPRSPFRSAGPGPRLSASPGSAGGRQSRPRHPTLGVGGPRPPELGLGARQDRPALPQPQHPLPHPSTPRGSAGLSQERPRPNSRCSGPLGGPGRHPGARHERHHQACAQQAHQQPAAVSAPPATAPAGAAAARAPAPACCAARSTAAGNGLGLGRPARSACPQRSLHAAWVLLLGSSAGRRQPAHRRALAHVHPCALPPKLSASAGIKRTSGGPTTPARWRRTPTCQRVRSRPLRSSAAAAGGRAGGGRAARQPDGHRRAAAAGCCGADWNTWRMLLAHACRCDSLPRLVCRRHRGVRVGDQCLPAGAGHGAPRGGQPHRPPAQCAAGACVFALLRCRGCCCLPPRAGAGGAVRREPAGRRRRHRCPRPRRLLQPQPCAGCRLSLLAAHAPAPLPSLPASCCPANHRRRSSPPTRGAPRWWSCPPARTAWPTSCAATA